MCERERKTERKTEISLSFALQIFRNTRKVSDFTYHSKKSMFSEGRKVFFGLINIFLSQKAVALPSQILQVFAVLMQEQ